MSDHSPSAQRICAIAVGHFAEVGYDASSLTQIAAGAGMRKPSLYAHFSSKDALFLAVLTTALEQERAFVDQCFTGEDADQVPGESYCTQLVQRYRTSVHLRFLLRTVFAPPAAVHPVVHDGYTAFLARLETLFRERLRVRTGSSGVAVSAEEDLVQAYLGIVDSLHVELVYATPAAAERRRRALWSMFTREIVRHDRPEAMSASSEAGFPSAGTDRSSAMPRG
ncbi:TetR/AcrR family transcriptional regulator [Kocuria sabuli]|uniref:TetR/AcrR family transcriptional regulator n=1 Tax=Kocuria sabuli TaxID=3071448 RepID=UPI0034D518E2